MKLCHVALDGPKIKANASKHKAKSYKRMKEEEARLEAKVIELLKKAQAEDEEGMVGYALRKELTEPVFGYIKQA